MSSKASDKIKSRTIIIMVAGILVVCGFIWNGAWFGTTLSDEKIESYLSGKDGEIRDIQHALNQVDKRLVEGDRSVERFFPLLVTLAEHENAEIRKMAAWVMGDARHFEPFQAPLMKLLDDDELLVRSQAALGLARRGVAEARPHLIIMLDDIPLRAPEEGTLRAALKKDEPLITGLRVARIETADGTTLDVLSPFPGKVSRVEALHDEPLKKHDVVAWLRASDELIYNALVALWAVGSAEDIPAVRRIADGNVDVSDRTIQQAKNTVARLASR